MRWLALMSTLMLNWPSALVMAPCRVFFTETVTVERGVCAVESRTVPVIVLVCPKPAWDRSPATRKRMICRNLGIGSLFLKFEIRQKIAPQNNFLSHHH
jgi:hypothetical protein